ncbi:MAG TPA: Asp-tRNA(Asn)/Glu-tRNA(Gln) amidotransferase subunit GatC [Chloroflexota bacterium]|nr:Asp-tRNA(Asn)/Glu-tRNA(Gln) amidotransferase subunit GatC [Chloroflexota bacterium]
MPISRHELEHLCRLAHIALDESEMVDMLGQISTVVDHVSRLQSVDTEGIEPTAYAVPIDSVVRDDDTELSWPTEAVLTNAPRRYGDFFEVQSIFE